MKPAQAKPLISPELLNQIDLRVGTILTVTDVPDSEKLVALEVSFGDHKRTVLVGMKRERANPREIEGKQALPAYFVHLSRLLGDKRVRVDHASLDMGDIVENTNSQK